MKPIYRKIKVNADNYSDKLAKFPQLTHHGISGVGEYVERLPKGAVLDVEVTPNGIIMGRYTIEIKR
jgi:hypothetical protein